MKRLNQQNGFTLAELLIVVAIIAILTAVAVPVFRSVLERSKEATDLANLRAAYAEAAIEILEAPTSFLHSVDLMQDYDGWEDVNRDAQVRQHAIINLCPDIVPGVAYVWIDSSGTLQINQTCPSDIPEAPDH